MTEVIIPTTKKTKTSKKAQKPIMMNSKSAYNHIHVPTDNEILERSVPMELKYGVKSLVVKCSSLPAKANKDVLEATLNQSVFITNYLNKYLMVNQIAMLNDHKVGLPAMPAETSSRCKVMVSTGKNEIEINTYFHIQLKRPPLHIYIL